MGDNVFFYWTNEVYGKSETIPGRLSLEDFIQWHNPLEFNKGQVGHLAAHLSYIPDNIPAHDKMV